jgi:glycerophosphoryl diester phosphodiesterase
MHNPDDKKIFSKIKNSILSCAITFFVPLFVTIVLGMVDSNYNFSACWKSDSTFSTNVRYQEITPEERKLILQEASDYEPGVKQESNYESGVSGSTYNGTVSNTDSFVTRSGIAAGTSRCSGTYCSVAHRGYSTNYPDNTEIAFEEAGKAGFWAVEADVRMSKSGRLACNHDNDEGLDQKTSFETFLDICKKYKMAAVIDIKAGYGGEEKLRKMVEMVKQKGMMDEAIFQCSITSYLKTIKKYAPDARIWYLRDTYDSTVITKARDVGAEAVNINYVNVNQKVVDELHNANLRVCVYVIPSTKVKNTFLTYNTDYIMSNKPV